VRGTIQPRQITGYFTIITPPAAEYFFIIAYFYGVANRQKKGREGIEGLYQQNPAISTE
jgi:hypothetical protein